MQLYNNTQLKKKLEKCLMYILCVLFAQISSIAKYRKKKKRNKKRVFVSSDPNPTLLI